VAEERALGEALAADFDSHSRDALLHRGKFTVALSGGSLAAQFFPRLALVPFDRSRTHFFWADERAVPPSDPESNYAIAHALWLGPAKAPPANVHRIRGEDPDLRLTARAYAKELQHIAGKPPVLDYVLLGVGPDGHVASLFPGHPALESKEIVEVVEDSPKSPPRRLTLTMPVLTSAQNCVVVALGREKAAAIRDALERGADTPLGALIKGAADTQVLLDEAAASLLADRVK